MAALGVLVLASSAAAAKTWPSWSGPGHTNARDGSDPDFALSPATAPRLAVKWAFDGPGHMSANPTVAEDGKLYIPDWVGNLWCLDHATGEVIWTRRIAEYLDREYGDYARTSPAIKDDIIFIGSQVNSPDMPVEDQGAYVMAVNRTNGALLWKQVIEKHPYAVITSSPVVFRDHVYFGVSGYEILRTEPPFTSRGSVVKLVAATGEIVWQTFTLPEDSDGQGLSWAGASVWGSEFPIDEELGLIFVPTGNLIWGPEEYLECEQKRLPGQASCIPDDVHTDSVMAVDLETGAVRWSTTLIDWEFYNYGCILPIVRDPGCPIMGPDFDVGQGPILVGTDRIGVGTKSGNYFMMDRATGDLVWRKEIGPGSSLGGMAFGSAFDGSTIFAASCNTMRHAHVLSDKGNVKLRPIYGSSWAAVDAQTGDFVWQTADPKEGNVSEQSRAAGPVVVANGVLFAGTTDSEGSMYAMDTATGDIVWQHKCGGAVMSGPTIVNNLVIWACGYDKFDAQPGPGPYLIAFHLPETGAVEM